MADFTLSGNPLDQPGGGLSLSGLSELEGAFTTAAVVAANPGGNELTPAGVVSGLVVVTVGGEVVGTASFPAGTVALNANVTAGAGADLGAFGVVDGGFRIDQSGVESGSLGVSFLLGFAELEGSLTIEARVSGGSTNELTPTAVLEGAAAYDHGELIPVNGTDNVIEAAASANMTGEPDPLRDLSSPGYVYPNGTDLYLYGHDPTDTNYGGGQANFTIVVVFDPEIANEGQTGVIAAKHDAASNQQGWRVSWDSTTGEVSVRIATSTDGANRVDRPTAVGSGGIRTRSVIVARYDGTDINLHVNGALSNGTQTTTGTPGNVANNSSANFSIGADDVDSTPANFFRGAVCSVYLFDRTLNATEANSISQSGILPAALYADGNLILAFRHDRIRPKVAQQVFEQWDDEVDSSRYLTVVASANPLYVMVHDNDFPILFSDEWDLDFFNVAETIGSDANVVSDYLLNSSTTLATENGTLRLYNPPTETQEPEIVTGFRDYRSDITIFLGGRKDPASGTDVVWLEFYGIQVFYDAATLDLFIFTGDTGTPTRLEFGQELPLQGSTTPGIPKLLVVRYNAQYDLVTFFLGSTKVFELSTTVTGSPIANTGLRMCEGADWGGLNLSAGSAATDRRGAKVVPAAIPDSRIAQVIEGFSPDARSWDLEVFGNSSFRDALRFADPDLLFGNLVTAFYDTTRESDDREPSPPTSPNIDFLQTARSISGTVEIRGLPEDGTVLVINDGTTEVTFEFDNNSTVNTPGATAIVISASVNQTLLNIQSALNASALALTAETPIQLTLPIVGDAGYVPLTLDNPETRDADLAISADIPAGGAGERIVFVTLKVREVARGTAELAGQPDDGDQFTISDGLTSVTFEFDNNASVGAGNTSVTIGGDVQTTLANLKTAIDSSALALTTAAVVPISTTGDGTNDAGYVPIRAQAWHDGWEGETTNNNPIARPVNASGNLLATGLSQPAQTIDQIEDFVSLDLRSFEITDTLLLYVDNPYVVLEPEEDDGGDVVIPPFVNPQPSIISVTANEAHVVTAIANAGPTDAGDVRAWWEVELVPDDPTFNLRIDEIDDDFSINKNRTDTFQIPLGLSFDELRIRFVIESQVDPDQSWASLYVRMEGEEFDNDPPDILILPGDGDAAPPPQIDLTLSLEQQQFVVEEEVQPQRRFLSLSARSRYKTTRVFINDEDDPRIPGRNPDGFEFGLMSVIEQFETVAQDYQVHRVRARDIGFLDLVAVEYYGPGFEDFWWAIAYANRIIDPELDLEVGQELIIPSRTRVAEFLALKPGASGN